METRGTSWKEKGGKLLRAKDVRSSSVCNGEQQMLAASKKDPHGIRWYPLFIKTVHLPPQGAYETLCQSVLCYYHSAP